MKKKDAQKLPKNLFEQLTNNCYKKTGSGKICDAGAGISFVLDEKEKNFKLCVKIDSVNNVAFEISAIDKKPWLKIEENIFMPTDRLFIAAILTVWEAFAKLLEDKKLKTQQAELKFNEYIRRYPILARK